MKIRTVFCYAAILGVVALPAIAEDISVFSHMAGKMVDVPVLKVEKSPMSDLDFCTLLRGSYCGNQTDMKLMDSQQWLDMNLKFEPI